MILYGGGGEQPYGECPDGVRPLDPCLTPRHDATTALWSVAPRSEPVTDERSPLAAPTFGGTKPAVNEPVSNQTTPLTVVAIDVLEKNLNDLSEYAAEHAIALRSHTNLHKRLALARP